MIPLLPVLNGVTAGLGNLGIAAFGATLYKGMSFIDPLFDPLKKLEQDAIHFKFPYNSPDISALLKSSFRRDQKGKWARKALQEAGVSLWALQNEEYIEEYRKYWQAALESMGPIPSIQELYYLLNTGLMKNMKISDKMEQELLTAENKKYFDEIYKPKFDIVSIFDLHRRGAFDKDRFREEIARITGQDTFGVSQYEKLVNLLPTPSDIITMSVRDVFNPKQAEELGLFEEFEDNKNMVELMSAVGMGEVKIVDKNGNKLSYDVPKLLWGSHWQNVSPTQGYMMFQRLRPGRINIYKKDFPNIEPFELANLQSLLKANDYTTKYRDRLAAIAYNLPTLQDLRNAWEYGKISKEEFREQIIDRGYSEHNANIILETNIDYLEPRKELVKWNAFLKKYGKSFNASLKGYRAGTLTFKQISDAYTPLDIPQDRLFDSIAQIDIEINNEIASKYISMVHREYLMGLYTPASGISALTDGGLTQQRAGQYIAIWEREKTKPRKIARAGKLVQWYKEGWITSEELKERLENMGWSKADIVLYMTEAAEARSDLEERARLAAARTEKQRAAEEERQRKKNEKDSKAGPKAAQERVSVSTLQRWLKKDIINEDYFILQMRYYGFSEDDILRYMVEAIGNE